jgi:hypothetical protein
MLIFIGEMYCADFYLKRASSILLDKMQHKVTLSLQALHQDSFRLRLIA